MVLSSNFESEKSSISPLIDILFEADEKEIFSSRCLDCYSVAPKSNLGIRFEQTYTVYTYFEEVFVERVTTAGESPNVINSRILRQLVRPLARMGLNHNRKKSSRSWWMCRKELSHMHHLHTCTVHYITVRPSLPPAQRTTASVVWPAYSGHSPGSQRQPNHRGALTHPSRRSFEAPAGRVGGALSDLGSAARAAAAAEQSPSRCLVSRLSHSLSQKTGRLRLGSDPFRSLFSCRSYDAQWRAIQSNLSHWIFLLITDTSKWFKFYINIKLSG